MLFTFDLFTIDSKREKTCCIIPKFHVRSMASKLTPKSWLYNCEKLLPHTRTDKSTELLGYARKISGITTPNELQLLWLYYLTAVSQPPRARKARPTFSALPSMTHSSVQKSEALYRATGVHEQERDQKSV